MSKITKKYALGQHIKHMVNILISNKQWLTIGKKNFNRTLNYLGLESNFINMTYPLIYLQYYSLTKFYSLPSSNINASLKKNVKNSIARSNYVLHFTYYIFSMFIKNDRNFLKITNINYNILNTNRNMNFLKVVDYKYAVNIFLEHRIPFCLWACKNFIIRTIPLFFYEISTF